jgi:hypothetical protein
MAEQNRQSNERPERIHDDLRRPFEAFDFDKLLPPCPDDPPYRPWWVVSDYQDR